MMNFADPFQMKNVVCAAIGMSHGMGHVHVGLAIWLIAGWLTQRSSASHVPWIWVLGLELLNELVDLINFGVAVLPDTARDIVLTMLWPSILVLVARAKRRRAYTIARASRPREEREFKGRAKQGCVRRFKGQELLT